MKMQTRAPRYLCLVLGLTAAAAMLPATTSAQCGDLFVPPPHQGAGTVALPEQQVFGASLAMTYGNPTLGCLTSNVSYTYEWVMIVGPGDNEWIQVGWEKYQGLPETHYWIEARGPNYQRDEFMFAFDTAPSVYRIEASDDFGGRVWRVLVDSRELLVIPAAEMGWSNEGQWGVSVQWSGETNYRFNQMGGTPPLGTLLDYPQWQVDSVGGGWSFIVPTFFFDSWQPMYHGSYGQYYDDQGWWFKNWTLHSAYLPLVVRDAD